MTIDSRALWHQLNQRRIDERMTWPELAEVLGTSVSTLGRLPHGLQPKVSVLAAALLWLDQTDLAEFLTKDSWRTP